MQTQDNASGKPGSERLRYNLILSSPRSGSDFFSSALERCPSISYFREYFNPICNASKMDKLARCFGDERFDHIFNIMREFTPDEVEPVIRDTWYTENLNTTKENYSSLRLESLRQHFNVVCLIRNISHTIPSSRPEFLTCIAASFSMSGTYRSFFMADELNALKAFINTIRIDNIAQICILAMLVQHYVQVVSCVRFDIPIIRYEDLLRLDADGLQHRLACLSTFGVEIPAVVHGIIDTRFPAGADLLRQRQSAFKSLGVPSWIEDMIRFMASLSPKAEAEIVSILTPQI